MTVDKRASISSDVCIDSIGNDIKIIRGWERWKVLNGNFQRFNARLRRKNELGQFLSTIDDAANPIRKDFIELFRSVGGSDVQMGRDFRDIVVEQR